MSVTYYAQPSMSFFCPYYDVLLLPVSCTMPTSDAYHACPCCVLCTSVSCAMPSMPTLVCTIRTALDHYAFPSRVICRTTPATAPYCARAFLSRTLCCVMPTIGAHYAFLSFVINPQARAPISCGAHGLVARQKQSNHGSSFFETGEPTSNYPM